MSDQLPYEVSMLLPVSMRVMAQNEVEALAIVAHTSFRAISPPGVYSIGFPESMRALEVEDESRTFRVSSAATGRGNGEQRNASNENDARR